VSFQNPSIAGDLPSKPEFRPYLQQHLHFSLSTPRPLLVLVLGPSPTSATIVAGTRFLFYRVDTEAEPAAPPRPCFREPPASRGPRPFAPLPRPASLPGGPSPPMPPRRRWPARFLRYVLCFFFLTRCVGAGMAALGAAEGVLWRRMVLTQAAVDSPTLSHFESRSATRASRPTSSTPPATQWR
jgi:hypothetical protein